MITKEFIENVYEIAFGDDAINKEYTQQEVLNILREFSDKALAFDNAELNINVVEEEAA